jgi:hypothetical protein
MMEFFSAREIVLPPPPHNCEQLEVLLGNVKIKTGTGNVSECPLYVTMIVISFSM